MERLRDLCHIEAIKHVTKATKYLTIKTGLNISIQKKSSTHNEVNMWFFIWKQFLPWLIWWNTCHLPLALHPCVDSLMFLHHGTVGQTPWKPFMSKLKNHLKTFKMHQKVITYLNFVYNSRKNDKNYKIAHAKVTCEVIFLWPFLH